MTDNSALSPSSIAMSLRTEMQRLAKCIQQDLYASSRKQLAQAQSSRETATIEPQNALKIAEIQFNVFKENRLKKFNELESDISRGTIELEQVCSEIYLFLKRSEVPLPEVIPPIILNKDLASTSVAAILNDILARKKELQQLIIREKPYMSFFWTGQVQADSKKLLEACKWSSAVLKAFGEHAKWDCEKDIRENEDSLLPSVRRALDSVATTANRRFEDECLRIQRAVKWQSQRLREEVNLFWKKCHLAGSDWSPLVWQDWKPVSSPEFATRIGTLTFRADDLDARFSGVDCTYKLPALVPFFEGRGLLIDANGTAKKLAAETMQSAAMRALALIPPGKVRFTLIDPVGLGQNAADFVQLGDFSKELINGKVWGDSQHIEQQLTEHTEEIETIIQTYLRTKHASIQEYNREHNEIAEPYRILVIFDFPVNFTDASAKRLISIVKNGPRCGVYTMIFRDTSKPLPHGFNLSDLNENAMRVSFIEGKPPEGFHSIATVGGWFKLEDNDISDGVVSLDKMPPTDISQSIIKQTGALAAQGMKKAVPFEKLIETTLKPDSWASSSTADRLQVPLGPAGRGKAQELVLGSGQEAHALLVGRTGSGKTNLMHVIITNLALTYAPSQLHLYLIDFKGGVGFKRYAEYRLPHAKVIAIESEREFGMSVLRGLDDELKTRAEVFRTAGVDSLGAYRSKDSNAPTMPRIFLVVDEFQEFFTDNDDLAQQAKLIFDRLARQGRSFGIHFLLATQSLTGAAQLPSSIMGQIKVRIALPCSEADSRLILADDNKAAQGLKQAGEAIYNPMAGAIEGNNPFQVARFSEDSDLHKYLKQVADTANSIGIVANPIVFEGNEVARIERSAPINDLLTTHDWPQTAKSVALYLGEPVAIQPPVAVRLKNQSGCNMLILTRDEAEGAGICIATMISMFAQRRPGTFTLYIADFVAADSDWAEYSQEIAAAFPGEIQVTKRQRDIGAMLAKIEKEVSTRREDNKPRSSIYLVIQGFHRVKDLREEMEDDDGNNAVELLGAILRDGPEVGVHVIAWADTLPNVTRGLSRKAMREFGARIGTVMSNDDSMNFFDSLAAAKISKPHRAIFAEEDRPGQFVTFRPYSMASIHWLKEIGSRLKQRNGADSH